MDKKRLTMRAFQEILPQVGMGRYFNVDARRFAAQYAAATRRMWEATDDAC